MAGRTRLLAVLPWVLCVVGVTLLGSAAVLPLADSETSVETALTSLVETVALASFSVVGAVIAARLPANAYGWIWCALGIANGALRLSAALADGPGPSGRLPGVVGYPSFLAFVGLLVFVFLLFPTGRLPSRRWRWVSRATVILGVVLAAATPFARTALDRSRGTWQPSGVAGTVLDVLVTGATGAMVVLILIAMASLVPRFRAAGTVERQQLKWFLLAGLVNALYLSIDLLVGGLPTEGIWVFVEALVPSLVPVAVGISVLRYRLYEIDRVVSRTVSYGLLSALLVGVYLLVVALLRPLLEPFTGSSTLAVAGSTLAVAAVFNPARRRLQDAVDRRFDRARYDATRAVDAFAARLRNQVDLDDVTAGLQGTVVATVAPTRVGVWLSEPFQLGGR